VRLLVQVWLGAFSENDGRDGKRTDCSLGSLQDGRTQISGSVSYNEMVQTDNQPYLTEQ
jgi:hypothetical protein